MNSNDFDTLRNMKSNLPIFTQVKCKQIWSRVAESVHYRILYENVKVTKPILLLSSFGGYISVLYKDKGLSSVLPVYKLSMVIFQKCQEAGMENYHLVESHVSF